jgi:hypothetical protein
LEEVGEEVIMGADYIYTYVDTGSDLATFIHDIRFFVNNTSDEVIEKLMHIIYDDNYDYEDDNPRVILFNLVEAFEEVCNYANDIAFLKVKDSAVVFTGGFSWGDSPTDSFDIVMSVKEITIEMSNYNG